MAIINFQDNRTNCVGIGSVKSYCFICANNEVIASKENLPISVKMDNSIRKFTGVNAGEPLLRLRVNGRDITICKDCMKAFNKQINPCTCKKDAEESEAKIEVEDPKKKTSKTKKEAKGEK